MWRKCRGTDERKMSRKEKIFWRTEKSFIASVPSLRQVELSSNQSIILREMYKLLLMFNSYENCRKKEFLGRNGLASTIKCLVGC